MQEGINCDFEGLVKDLRDHSLEKHAGCVETGIGVDFDEVDVQIRVKHEVKAKEFKRVIVWCGFTTTDAF